ncbi:MAG: hypothetical protein B9S32_02010 [Verrucomicrobia bacterium Tous-C9LFEB]|nr:MAG: hypothetical protein B9S32_02010 [Verrucomicrobia bacterium Tous-C9LFEB]
MIIPTNRLLICFALIGVPALTLMGAGIPGGAVALMALGGLVLISIADVFWGSDALRELSFSFPKKLRLTEESAGEIKIRIDQSRPHQRTVLIAFLFPETITSERDIEAVQLPGETGAITFSWLIRAHRRGSFSLSEFYTGCLTPLKLWTLRRRNPLDLPISVYPSLHAERRGLEGLIMRGREGALLRRQLGQGREFEKLREYAPGDSYADIHWKATARRARPVTKLYQIERTQEVYVVLDTSRLSARPVTSKSGITSSCMDHYIKAALLLGLVAQRQKDHFGVIAFSDRLQRFVRAGSGLRHYHACRDALFGLEAQPVAANFQEVTSQIRLRLRKRALLIFLTNLDEPTLAEAFSHSVEIICRQHLIIANILSPPEAGPLFSAGTIETEADIYRKLAGHQQWQQLAELQHSLHQRNVQLFQMQEAHMAVTLVEKYLEIKQSQRL